MSSERAVLAGQREQTAGVEVVGGIVLNSPVGGANADGVTLDPGLGLPPDYALQVVNARNAPGTTSTPFTAQTGLVRPGD